MNKLLKTLFRTGAYFLDQADEATSGVRGRVRERVDGLTDQAVGMVRGREDNSLRYAVSFAAGIGLGIGAGILLAPASGAKTREAMKDRLQVFGNGVRERISHATEDEAVSGAHRT